jgi:anti-sigma regulatory factor (Ser/Thr protein kinase)
MSSPAQAAGPGGVRAVRVEGDRLVLALQDTLAAVEGARLEIARHLAPLALPAKVANRLEVVLEELITNIVFHGLETVGGHAILVALAPQPDVLTLVVEDDGRPFNPLLVEAPPPAASIETAPIGGRGIPAIRRIARALRYEALPDSPDWAAVVGAGAPVNRLVVEIEIAG